MSRGKLVNIGGKEGDENHRYKMPALQTKIEGRGNGIKTVLVNIVEVCKPLRTQPDWVTKFFGMENGALSRFDPKRMVGIVNGAHQATEFQKDLKTYVNDFILCPKCKLPELQTKVDTKKSLLIQKCMSCNWKGKNTSIHKVKTYMINHPPEKKVKEKEDTDGKEKVPKRQIVSTKVDENNVSWQADPHDKEIAQRTQEQLELLAKSKRARLIKIKTKISEKEEEENPDNAGIDDTTTTATGTATTATVTSPTTATDDTSILTSNTTSDVNMDATLGGPVEVLRLFFNECDHSLDEQLDEIHRLKLAYGLDDEHKYKVLLDASLNCNDEQTLIQSLKEHKLLLQQLTLEPSDAEQFFRAFEVILARRNQGRLQDFVNEILLCLFDEEIVSKDSILNWFHKESERAAIEIAESIQVKHSGKVFFDWLKGDGQSAD